MKGRENRLFPSCNEDGESPVRGTARRSVTAGRLLAPSWGYTVVPGGPEIFSGGYRDVSQIFHAPNVVGTYSGGLKEGTIIGNLVMGVSHDRAQLLLLHGLHSRLGQCGIVDCPYQFRRFSHY